MTRAIRIIQGKPAYNDLYVRLITDIRPDSILAGSLDLAALLALFDSGCQVTIIALTHVHAKVYLADTSMVWITSANLTTSALDRNFEYGITVNSPSLAAQVAEDLDSYARVGSPASRNEIQHYAETIQGLREEYKAFQRETERAFRKRFREQLDAATEEALTLQIGVRSAHAVFSDTIVHLLRSGPLSTQALHPLIQALLPELCDDQTDRIINGRHFGKLWKHHVRTAQQHLKRNGVIRIANGRWELEPTAIQARSELSRS